jgi:hypothetical protein
MRDVQFATESWSWVFGSCLCRPFIGRDDYHRGASEDCSPFRIGLAGMKRAGPDGLLVVQDVPRQPQPSASFRSFTMFLFLIVGGPG